MAVKCLGQVDLTAATDTTLYTVPASKSTVVSSVSFCNRGAAAVKVRLAHRKAGAAISNPQYVCYDTSVAANSSLVLTIGIACETTDVLTVRTDTATVNVLAWGDES